VVVFDHRLKSGGRFPERLVMVIIMSVPTSPVNAQASVQELSRVEREPEVGMETSYDLRPSSQRTAGVGKGV
jgi:hypothetical protein